MLVQSQNESLKQEYLPHLSNGQILLGVGFSHLRRRRSADCSCSSDWGLSATGTRALGGFGLFQEFIVAAALPDGQAVFGVVPFVETYQDALGAITFSQPMALAAMTSTNTVTATLTNWFYLKSASSRQAQVGFRKTIKECSQADWLALGVSCRS